MFKRSLLTIGLMFVLGLSSNLFAQKVETVQLNIQPQSKMKVDGNSTLHKWSADAKAVDGYFKVPSTMLSAVKVGETFSEGKVSIPVKKLDSGEGGMNKKMYGALKTKKNPTINYKLTSAKVVSVDGTKFTLDTNGELTIAGSTKPIEMKVQGVENSDGTIQFTGSKDMKMTEFGVKPPTALFGTIKSDDAISVSFTLVTKKAASSM